MHVVAVLSLATTPEVEAPRLAADLGLTAYETRMMLVVPPPAVVLTSADEARADALGDQLRGRGHEVAVCDAATVVRRPEMVAMRHFALDPDGLRVGDQTLAFGDLVALVRAQMRSVTTTTSEVKEKQIAPVKALLSGGLLNSKTVTKEVTTRSEEREQVLFLFPRIGVRPWILVERQTNFSALGPKLAPTSLENFSRLTALLREQAPEAVYDERLLRGVRSGPAADVELMAHLIALSAASRRHPYRAR